MKTQEILKKPSAFIPVGMSLVALLIIILHIILIGTAPQPDEGTEAHIWQLMMAFQIPIIVFFAIKWLPRIPKQALFILALQAGAAVLAAMPVYFLGW